MASIVVEDLSPIRKRVTFEVPEETVLDAIESQYVDIKKNVQIKGFRKGKAPLQIIRRYFKGKVEVDALQKVIQDTLEPGLEKENIKALSILSVEPGKLEIGKPFSFSAEVEVTPSITLSNYKGIVLKKPSENVSEEMLQNQLERIRNMNAQLVPIPEHRGAQKGDYLIVDIEAQVEGQTVESLTVDDYHLEMGRDFYLPGFDVHLEGIRIDETRDIVVDFPDDFPNKNLAGKKGSFSVFCQEIKERVIPELDDEFARDLGSYNNLSELREAVRLSLEREIKGSAQSQIRDQLKQQLLENHDFEVPNSLVEQKLGVVAERFLEAYKMQGADPKKLLESGAIPREAIRPVALREAKLSLILQAIADQESIDATQEELDEEYALIAERLQMTPDETRAFVKNRFDLAFIRNSIIERKTFQFLEQNATFVESDESAVEDQAQPSTETA